MSDKKFKVETGPDSPFSVGTGKQKKLLKLDGPGVLVAIYYTITQRTTELLLNIDGELTELPTLTKLNTMKLLQTATIKNAGLKIHEYESTSPYGFAYEHPVEFDSSLVFTISNESGATATLGHYIVLWEKCTKQA